MSEYLLSRQTLDDGETTTVYVEASRAREEQHVWCRASRVHEAVVGGFFVHLLNRPYSDQDQPAPQTRRVVTALAFEPR